jgi:hypothetical protein
LEEEGHVGPPPSITEDNHIEQLMDIPETTSSPTIVAPYPTSTRQLRCFVIPAPKQMSRVLRRLQSNHVAYVNKQVLPEVKAKAYKKHFVIIQAAFYSVAGSDDGTDTPISYNDVLKH